MSLDAYREAARAWVAANLDPRPPGAELRAAHDVDPERLAAERALQKKVYEAGYAGIVIPTEYGGQGLTRDHLRVWREEAAAYAAPAPGGVAYGVTHGIVLPTLLAHGSEAQKRAWIPKMLSAEEIWVQLLSEPGAGSDLAGVLTRATRDGDSWVLNGAKVWSSGAMSADFGICLARTDWDAPKHRGLTWFKVPLRDPRVTVRPIREINGSAEFCEEFLDDVIVGDDMVIGDVNGGWPVANTMLVFERSIAGNEARPLDRDHSRRRLAPDLVELARGRDLTSDGAARQIIARAHVNDYMHGLLTQRIVEKMLGSDANPSLPSLIKLASGAIGPQRAAAAMELAGQGGVAWEGPAEPGHTASINWLNGRIMAIAGGSNQIQRNIISERLLGLPREPSADVDKPFSAVLRDAKSWGTKPRG